MLADGVIALLSSVGLVTVLWCIAEWIFRGRNPAPKAVVLMPLCGDVEEYEVQTVLAHQRRLGSRAPIVLLDCGLCQEDRRRAELLTERYEGVTLITAEELADYWKKN